MIRQALWCALLATFGAALSGCGRDAGTGAASPFIHTPALKQLTPQQLRSLSMECQKYAPGAASRGPYDLAYCEAAIAAWGDAPLELIQIQEPGARP